VAGKSVSHHHPQSTWQRTELRQVYGDTGVMETDWETGAYRDTGVAEMDGVMGGIYSGDPGVDSVHRILYLISSHLISSYHTMNYTHLLSNLFISLALPRLLVDPRNCVGPHSRVVSYLLTLFLCSSSQNCFFSRIPFGMPWEVRPSVEDELSAF